MQLDFGLGRQYNSVFYVADDTTPMLGVDFLGESKFIINIHNASITDKCTNTTVIQHLQNLAQIKTLPPLFREMYILLFWMSFPASYQTSLITHQNSTLCIEYELLEDQCTGSPADCTLTSLHLLSLPMPSFFRI